MNNKNNKIYIRTINHEFIHLHEVHVVVDQVNFMTKFIVFWTKENANYTRGGFVAVDGNMIGEWFMIQTVLTSLDQSVPGFFVATNGHSVAEQGLKVIEVSDEFVYSYGLNGHTREAQFIYGVTGNIFLVSGRRIFTYWLLYSWDLLEEDLKE